MSKNPSKREMEPGPDFPTGRQEKEESAAGMLRILILEDMPSDADLIEYELREAELCFTALRVKTEAEYVHALEKFSPDLIISDYDLPQYNGSLALAEARARCPGVPFILVTGALEEDRAIDSLENGGRDYVMKQHLRKLAPAVKRALAEKQEFRERQAVEAKLREAQSKLASNAVKERAESEEKTEKSNQAERALIKLLYEMELKKRM